MSASSATTSPKDLVKDSYNSIAPAYLDFITKLPSPAVAWLDKLLHQLPSPQTAKVLELGSGNGIPGTLHLAPRVAHVTANDISSAQIDIAREKLAGYQNVEFIVGDMTALKFEAARFDAITALHSIFHLPRDEQPVMLKLVNGWLKPGGLLLINFDEEANPGKVMENWLGADMYSSGFGVEESKKMVTDAGFDFIESEVVKTVDGRKTVPFLWVLARKSS